MDKDSQLIFETYLNSKNDILFEGEKWEDKSSAWAWLKILDPTGLSAWPDVLKSIKNVSKNSEDVLPWVNLILNIFLALPNFGILAFGIGAGWWAVMRAAAKAALQGTGRSQGIDLANKILKKAAGFKFFQAALIKIANQLKKEGVSKNIIDNLIDSIKKGKLTKLGKHEELVSSTMKSELKQGLGKTAARHASSPYKYGARAVDQAYNRLENWSDEIKKEKEEEKKKKKFVPRKEKSAVPQGSNTPNFKW